MAFPLVETRTPSNEGAQVTSHTVTLPASPTTGNLLVAVVYFNGTSVDAWPAGWTEFFTTTSTDGDELAAAWHEVTGSEGSSITVTSLAAGRSGHLVYEVSGGKDPTTQPPEGSTGAELESDFNPDPDSLTPTGGAEDFLWLVIAGSQGATITTAPTNYTDLTNAHGGGTGGGAAELAAAERNLNASSENPGTFTQDAARDWVAGTLVVHPASASGVTFPSAPTNLTATAVSTSQIDLSWDAVSGAGGYDIERDSVVIVSDHQSTSYSDTGLNTGQSYDYRVRAVS